MNFLEHEMRVTFFFRHFGSPSDPLRGTARALVVGILDLNLVAADDREFAVLQEDHFLRVRQ